MRKNDLIGYTSLASLPMLREYTSHRISSYDKIGGNEDDWQIKGGERKVLAAIDGPGCVKHIWMTLGLPKHGCRYYKDLTSYGSAAMNACTRVIYKPPSS